MRYFWNFEKQKDGTLDIQYHPGKGNLVNYITKHHPPKHHTTPRPIFLHTPDSPMYLQRTKPPHVMRGCVKS